MQEQEHESRPVRTTRTTKQEQKRQADEIRRETAQNMAGVFGRRLFAAHFYDTRLSTLYSPESGRSLTDSFREIPNHIFETLGAMCAQAESDFTTNGYDFINEILRSDSNMRLNASYTHFASPANPPSAAIYADCLLSFRNDGVAPAVARVHVLDDAGMLLRTAENRLAMIDSGAVVALRTIVEPLDDGTIPKVDLLAPVFQFTYEINFDDFMNKEDSLRTQAFTASRLGWLAHLYRDLPRVNQDTVLLARKICDKIQAAVRLEGEGTLAEIDEAVEDTRGEGRRRGEDLVALPTQTISETRAGAARPAPTTRKRRVIT